MTFEEFESAKEIVNEINKIDEKISLLNNKYENFLATSYKGENLIVRKSMIIDKEMKKAIIDHLIKIKENRLNDLSKL